MRCTTCDEPHQPRDGLRESKLCRGCKYLMDFFALNGNRLEEYHNV